MLSSRSLNRGGAGRSGSEKSGARASARGWGACGKSVMRTKFRTIGGGLRAHLFLFMAGLQSETGVHPCVRKDGGSVHRQVYGSWEGTIVLTTERTGNSTRCG